MEDSENFGNISIFLFNRTKWKTYPDTPTCLDYIQLDNIKKVDLNLQQILKNNIALSYFIDYVSSAGKQLELFFYLNIEGWKVSVEQQLSDLHINKIKGINDNPTSVYEAIRSTALSIYTQYLGEKSEQRVQVKPALAQSLYFKIRNLNETPSEAWFDEVQNAIYEKMENSDDFMPAFKRSKAYVKLLQELDLLQQSVVEEDAISLNSNESLEMLEPPKFFSEHTTPLQQSSSLLVQPEKSVKHARSFSDVTMFIKNDNGDIKFGPVDADFKFEDLENQKVAEKNLKSGEFVLAVNIIETGMLI